MSCEKKDRHKVSGIHLSSDSNLIGEPHRVLFYVHLFSSDDIVMLFSHVTAFKSCKRVLETWYTEE